MVVKGLLLASQTLRQDSEQTLRVPGPRALPGQSHASPAATTSALSSWTWESTFISGPLPAEIVILPLKPVRVESHLRRPRRGQLLLLWVFAFAGVLDGCSHIFQI